MKRRFVMNTYDQDTELLNNADRLGKIKWILDRLVDGDWDFEEAVYAIYPLTDPVTERTSLWENSLEYYKARPLPYTSWDKFPKGNKFKEEAEELVDELCREVLDIDAIKKEIGDVANTLSWIAHCFDTTVEECQFEIIEKDRGRGLGNPNRYQID
jgi:hypothetical protein